MLNSNKKTYVIGVLIALSYAGSVDAGVLDWAKGLFSGSPSANAAANVAISPVAPQPIDPNIKLGSDCLDGLSKERQAKIDADGQIIDGMIKVPTTGIADMPCLKRFQDFKISSTIGLPSFQGVIDTLKKQACSAVDNNINAVNQKVSQSVNMGSGGIINGTVNTGVFSNSGGTPPLVVGQPTVNDTSGGLPNIFSKIGL